MDGFKWMVFGISGVGEVAALVEKDLEIGTSDGIEMRRATRISWGVTKEGNLVASFSPLEMVAIGMLASEAIHVNPALVIYTAFPGDAMIERLDGIYRKVQIATAGQLNRLKVVEGGANGS